VGLGGDWDQVATDVYTYYIGDLAAGESGSVEFRLQLSDTIPASVWVVSNTVEIDHDITELAFETDLSNNRATDENILQGPDLTVVGVDISPADPEVGKPITFTVTVLNQGKDQTNNDAGSAWFLVELYLKGSEFTPAGPPSNVFDHAGGYWSDASGSQERISYLHFFPGLVADGDDTWAFVIDDIEDVDDYHVYVQVDVSFDNSPSWPWTESYGLVREAVETNNIYSYGVIHVGGRRIHLPLVTKNR
jgi:hypothetical protein